MSHWKGFSSYNQLAHGKDEVFHWFDRTQWHRDGKKRDLQAYLKSGRLVYTPLPSLAHMKAGKRESYIRREVRAMETAFRAEREDSGQKAMTATALEKLNPRDRPKTRPPRTQKPLCHCSCPGLAEMYRTLLFYFLEAYGRASALYRNGNHAVAFPSGSYKPPLIVMNT